MAKEKNEDYKAQYEEQRTLAEAANAQLATLTEKVKTIEKAAAKDQELKEDCLRLLWLARFVLQPCKTKKDIDNFMPKLREWVGTARAEEVERAFRK